MKETAKRVQRERKVEEGKKIRNLELRL